MAEEQRALLDDFLAWMRETYRGDQVFQFQAFHRTDYMFTPQWKFWVANVRQGAMPVARQQPTEPVTFKSVKEAEDYYYDFLNRGDITPEKYKEYVSDVMRRFQEEEGKRLSPDEVQALQDCEDLDELADLLYGHYEGGAITLEQIQPLYDEIADTVVKGNPIEVLKLKDQRARRKAEKEALKPKKLTTSQRNTLVDYYKLGREDLAEGMLVALVSKGFIRNTERADFASQAKYEADLEKSTTLAGMEAKGKAEREAFWAQPLEERGKYGAFGQAPPEGVIQKGGYDWKLQEMIPGEEPQWMPIGKSVAYPTGEEEEYEYQKMMKRKAMGMPLGLKEGGRAETDWLLEYHWKQKLAELEAKGFEPRAPFEQASAKMQGSYGQWFEGKYSTELSQFRASKEAELPTVPWEKTQTYIGLMASQPIAEEELGGGTSRAEQERKFEQMQKDWGARFEAARTSYIRPMEIRWTEWLEKRKLILRKEYEEEYPYGMGGRPWAYAPRIETLTRKR